MMVSERFGGLRGFYKWLPILILIMAPVLVHGVLWMTGLSSNPIWTESGTVSGIGPGLIGALDFSDPNVGWTNQALGHLAAQDWLHFVVPWWNPYSGIGMPLAGEMQPAALFLPFVLLLSFQAGIVWLEIVLQVFAGIATFALLRRLELGRLSALTGGLLLAFSGTFAWVPGETILNVMPFLPLLLHGIEDARDGGHKRRAVVLIGLGIGGSILAGFPETAYIDGLFALSWAVMRLGGVPDRAGFVWRVGLGGGLGLMLAAPQIVAFVDFSLASGVFQAHRFGFTHINYRGFAVVVLPYVFGPLGMGANNKLLMQVSGSTGGYVGLLVVLFGAAGFTVRRDRGLLGLLAVWLVLSMGKMFGFGPIMALVNAVPLMGVVEFSRYSSPSWELAAIIVACIALDGFRDRWMGLGRPLLVTGLCLAVVIWFASPWEAVWQWQPAGRAIMVGWFARALGFELAMVAVVVGIWLGGRGTPRRVGFAVVLVLNAMALFIVPQLSGHRPGRVDVRAVRYFRAHMGLQRFYTLGPIVPNYGAYFGIASLNHMYLPVAANWADYVRRHLLYDPQFGNGDIFFAPFRAASVGGAVDDLTRFRDAYRYLGTRYIVADKGTVLTPTVTVPAKLGAAAAHALYPGQSITINGIVDASLAAVPLVSRIGVNQGNYDHTATGLMTLALCSGGICTSGGGDLGMSRDNLPFIVDLDRAVPLRVGAGFSLTIDHRTGTTPDAIWFYPAKHSAVHGAVGGVTQRRMPEIVFGVRADRALFRKVYTDRLMTIWRLGGAQDFYTTEGAACRMGAASVNAATIDCAGAATLVRRELFMAGWHVTDNGNPAVIHSRHAVVQAVALHKGRNVMRFWFAPPGVGWAWLAFWLGVLGLMWQMVGPWITPTRRQSQ